MKNPDVTLTEINGIIRVTFVSNEAKKLAIDEPDFAPYINRKDGFIYLDISKTVKNKNNMISYLVSHNFKSIVE